MPDKVYRNFDIWIGQLRDGYLAKAWSSETREAKLELHSSISDLNYETLLELATSEMQGQPKSELSKRLISIGKQLFSELFRGEIALCYYANLEEAIRQAHGLRIRLRLADAPNLSRLPWELLFDPQLDHFLALSSQIPIVRYLEIPSPVRPLSLTLPLRVIAILANPCDRTPLDSEGEWKRLKLATATLEKKGVVLVEKLPVPTLASLRHELRRSDFHVIHFIGHGEFLETQNQEGTPPELRSHGRLLFETETGSADAISGLDLGRVLRDHQTIRLVVLNTCYGAKASAEDAFSGVAQTLTRHGVHSTLGMQTAISDEASAKFTYELYCALADGYPIDACLAEARKALATAGSFSWTSPVLYMRSSDGHLFSSGVGRQTQVIKPKEMADEHSRLETTNDSLESAYRIRAEMDADGRALSDINNRIVHLRRQLREDGQIKEGDFLHAGRYKLLKKVGRGGFAEVWKVYDSQEHTLVAAKILHSQYSRDVTRKERFFRGARKMQQLMHKNIARVFNNRCEDRNLCFFIMEYLPLGDLRQAVLDGTITQSAALRAIAEVGKALSHAHARKIIHRDVKPANVLLTQGGEAKLTDFDLVWASDTTGGTRTGGLGTFLYSAPELMSEPQNAREPADIYGLAMSAIFAIHGSDLPLEILRYPANILNKAKAPPSLAKALTKAISWDPRERGRNIKILCTELRRCADAYESTRPTDTGAPLTAAKSGPSIRSLPKSYPLRRLQNPMIYEYSVNEKDGSLLVRVPEGRYTLGADDDRDIPRFLRGRSRPAHQVRLSSFWIGVHTVTNEQYAYFLGLHPKYPKPVSWGDAKFGGPQQPVVGVSWLDAMAYCQWADLCLPSEAQWEVASRGAESNIFPWGGEEPKDDKANFLGTKTTQVGKYPNGVGPYGTFDQAGNVWEWCVDFFEKEIYAMRSRDEKNPIGTANPRDEHMPRVVRGGSWADSPKLLKSFLRYNFKAKHKSRLIGFRVARLIHEE